MTSHNHRPKQGDNNHLQQNNNKPVANTYLSKLAHVERYYLTSSKEVYFLDTHQKLPKVVQDNRLIRLYFEAIKLIDQLINGYPNSHIPLFKTAKDIENSPFAQLLLNRLHGKIEAFWSYNCYKGIQKYFPFHQLHVYFKLAREVWVFRRFANKKQLSDCELLNLFISRVRQKANNTTLKRQQQQLVAACLKNYRNLHLYIEQLSKSYPQFFISYLVLYPLYPQETESVQLKANLSSYLLLQPSGQKIQAIVDYKMVKTAREDFFKGLKKQAMGKLIKGYAWKLNYNA